MAVTIVSTPGAVNANSYLEVAEATAYFATRVGITAWDNADDQALLLVMATRVMEAMFGSARRELIHQPLRGSIAAYYLTYPTWTGFATTTTQALTWPRTGMFTRTGVAIGTMIIPQEIKNATAELAGQLAIGDRTLDNEVIAQGLTSLKAGSVSLTFKSDFTFNVIPTAVWNLLVQSWLTDELYEPAIRGAFTVM